MPENISMRSLWRLSKAPFIKRVVRQTRLVVVVLPLEGEGDTDRVSVGGIPVVHLLEYLTIHIKPATPSLLTLCLVRFGFGIASP